jgi:Lrp/AsnC family transcriptional regulator of ectoine degradation
MIKLDSKDIQILSVLQRDGRITKTALSEQIYLSPTPCWERIKRLEKAGIIAGYGAQISIANIGNYATIFMEIKIVAHQSRDFDLFESAVQNMDEVLECWAVGGELDYLLKIAVPNIDEYQAFVDRVLDSEIGLLKYSTYIVTKRVKESSVLAEPLLNSIFL